MKAALAEAQKGFDAGGIPIGSVITHTNQIVARGHNQRIQQGSVIRHGEMDALENLGRKPASFYCECTMYTTLSPCPMCSGALLLYEIPKVVVGENRTFLGAEELLRSKGVEVIVMDSSECYELMQKFIGLAPHIWNEDIGEP